MQFKKEVQELLEIAGWYKGRNLSSYYNALPRFNELPSFLKQFFYEYGNLKVETYKYEPDEVTAVLDLSSDWFKEKVSITDSSFFGGQKMFAVGYYDLDNAVCECDKHGNVYIVGDAPIIISDNFQEGIERIIMEDYSDIKKWWHYDIKRWKEEEY